MRLALFVSCQVDSWNAVDAVLQRCFSDASAMLHMRLAGDGFVGLGTGSLLDDARGDDSGSPIGVNNITHGHRYSRFDH